MQLKYKTSEFEGGRLHTPYQTLPNSTFWVSINTLIDKERICEVDFIADHLRLNLAVLHSQDAGETPYEDIGELCKVDDRNRIKKFITVSMVTSDESEAF